MKDLKPIVEVDEKLEAIADFEERITEAEAERDALIARYQMKIEAAREMCERRCEPYRIEIAALTESLKRYAADNLPEGKQSIVTPFGKLSFRKQPPKFYFDETAELTGKDERLIAFAKASAPEFIKTTEYVAWDKLKPKLSIVGEEVYLSETGELIEGLHVKTLPDKFTVKTL